MAERVNRNALSWYNIKEGSHILQIGARDVEITELLCEKATSVVCVEMDNAVASDSYRKTNGIDNYVIYTDSLFDIDITDRFDYVVISDVFAYANTLSDTENPYNTLLQKIKSLMKKEAKLLLMTENRLGLKYFAGAPEEYTGNYFLGLADYEGNADIRTFSKAELTDLLQKNGFRYLKYYYPYPDYKFPTAIFTDLSLTEDKYGEDYYNYNGDRAELYNEGKVAKSFIREGVMDRFVNSFIVEASLLEEEQNNQIIYVKFSDDRYDKYGIATSISIENGEKAVKKYALDKAAADHIAMIYKNSNREDLPSKVKNLKCEKDGEAICYKYLADKNLSECLVSIYNDRDKSSFINCIKKYFDVFNTMLKTELKSTADFERVFGSGWQNEKCINPANIDMIFDNAYPVKEEYIIIDCEWIFDFAVPFKYIVWRAVNDFYTKHPYVDTFVESSEIYNLFSISQEDQQQYIMWNAYFCKEYVGVGKREKASIDKTIISLNQIMWAHSHKDYNVSSVYIDTGNGYTEEGKIYEDIILKDNEQIDVIFDIKSHKDIKSLRWDPVENMFCEIEIISIDGCEDKKPLNAIKSERGKSLFLTIDPAYELCGIHADEISISYRVHKLESKEVQNMVYELESVRDNEKKALMKRSSELEEQKSKLEEQKSKLEEQNSQLQNTLNDIYQSKTWKLITKYRKLTKKV